MIDREELRSQYEEQGFVVVRGLLDRAAIRRALDEALALYESDLASSQNLRCRFRQDAHTGESRLETFDPIVDVSSASSALALDERLLALLHDLYGEPACLFKDKLIYKPPRCPGYELHQDFIAWPGFPRSFTTVLIPLESAHAENGCTIVYPGYHRAGCLSTEDGDYHELPRDTVDESKAVLLELEPGDVAVFGGFTPHRSATNRSPRWRRQLYVSYNKRSDGGEQRDAHYAEFHRWLGEKYGAAGQIFR